ncbi:hypothetical protein H5410_037454 [Solanum commersonii]|uniref:Uncharacterized protein n=1 Tax=Solanum commersonii TaxID=4109 RepID=A0A9J5YB94_SOLCO|nr:hypothetical protein H5410_037454 [Solanum commersonii]
MIVKKQKQQYEEPTIPFGHKFQKGKALVLLSGRVVGDPGVWKVTKQKSPISQPPLLESKFATLAEESSSNEASSSHNNIETNFIESNFDYRTFQKLPSNGRKIFNLDQQSTPQMRI